ECGDAEPLQGDAEPVEREDHGEDGRADAVERGHCSAVREAGEEERFSAKDTKDAEERQGLAADER
ncbi:MAG TPA: hypothetical protein VLT16_15195, partial [Candidatus Limnocylindrales bacterium]|nr:hypothetical protein [Candidatus Limnocylindrales bacterium]